MSQHQHGTQYAAVAFFSPSSRATYQLGLQTSRHLHQPQPKILVVSRNVR